MFPFPKKFSVKINTTLVMMREWAIPAKYQAIQPKYQVSGRMPIEVTDDMFKVLILLLAISFLLTFV